ncbi:MAG: hypothetical protein CML44_13720 [Rhodobacteraceae bacterium]|nr:hypothetical protein [Paracoccaceae bacterium]|tara:strand:- start:89 stop:1168 length:1080 start_codon:yes stop_codon:yes gene_type:complete
MINIFGVIGQDVGFVDVMEQIQADKSEELDVLIYSVGGSLYEGLAIYDALKNDNRKVTTTILGLGASSASAIFSAGDVRLVGDASEFMIHNVLVNGTGGNKYELMETVNKLDNEDQKLISIYESITSLSREDLESMMKVETKLNAEQAIELGFATGKANTMAMVAQFNNKIKDEDMSDIEEKEVKGFFALCKEFFNKSEEPVAMDEEEEEDAKAESEEAPEAMEEKEEAEAMDEEEEEAEDSDEEMEALKAKVAELELALEAKLDKEVEAEKQSLVFEAIKDNKLTLAEGRDVMALGLEDVQAKLEEASISPSGYEKGSAPVAESIDHYAEYKALKGSDQSAFFAKHKDIILNEINKDK